MFPVDALKKNYLTIIHAKNKSLCGSGIAWLSFHQLENKVDPLLMTVLLTCDVVLWIF